LKQKEKFFNPLYSPEVFHIETYIELTTNVVVSSINKKPRYWAGLSVLLSKESISTAPSS